MRSALATLPAIYEVGVDFDTQAIYVSYDASLGDAKAAAKPMLAALKRAGFDPWFKAEGWPDGAEQFASVLPEAL